jgi:hypothetical protein
MIQAVAKFKTHSVLGQFVKFVQQYRFDEYRLILYCLQEVVCSVFISVLSTY